MTENRRQYKNPPIVEALCELKFAPTELDFDFPWLLHEKLRTDYPEKPIYQSFIQQPNVVKLRFSAENGSRLLVVGANSVSVHDLKPYSGWQNLKPRIEQAYKTYSSLAKVSVIGMNVRYVNAFRFPVLPTDLREYFTFLPPKLEGVPEQLKSCLVNVQLDYPDNPYSALITLTNGPLLNQPPPHLVLDINLVLNKVEPSGMSDSKVLEVVEDLRTFERRVFEALITDKSREMFDA